MVAVENAFNVPGVFQGAVGAFCASTAPAASTARPYISDYIPRLYGQKLTVGVEIVVSCLIFRTRAIRFIPSRLGSFAASV